MPNPFRDLFFGSSTRALTRATAPRRTFADVVLPPATRSALEQALTQIHKHELIFGAWGLGERHDAGTGLAFNFAGPPGTGKTICAEAIASALGKRLLVVRYDELESQWAGVTGKNVAAVFAAAAEEDAVLFFDEADAIAGRRFTAVDRGYEREANAVVGVLLREVESFPGVVIFATNLAANFDPAFERRIRNHILFEMPGPVEREQIWEVQLHPRTPLAEDVDFGALARAYPASGGDIKNAVLKAAQAAASEPGPDGRKRIGQRHFETAIQEVLAARRVMDQSLFAVGNGAPLPGDALDDEVTALTTRLMEVEDAVAPLPDALREQGEAVAALRAHTDEALAREASDSLRARRLGLALSGAALLAALSALGLALA